MLPRSKQILRSTSSFKRVSYTSNHFSPSLRRYKSKMSSSEQNPTLIGGHAQYVKGAAEVCLLFHLSPPSLKSLTFTDGSSS
jgi:hypothetical protein